MKKNMNKISSILRETLEKVKPSDNEMKEIRRILKEYLKKVSIQIKKKKITAQIFVGGSFAKNTMIKKDSYDVDIFIRFDKKYKDELLSDMTEKILETIRKERIHGSRDYFKTQAAENLYLEFVPVRKVSNPKEAKNITDLSYSHVRYVNRKIKSRKTLDEIRLAKAFCFANGAYGAESYIQGFSGYGLELLVYHYKSFLGLIKAIAKMDLKKKVVIDIEKHHKNKNMIMMDINAAKLQSPIILVDPTYKHRNVLAALSEETLIGFQETCKEFLKNPSADFFSPKRIDLEKARAEAKSKGHEFVLIGMATARQPGDIAGSKLVKFYRHLGEEAEKFFKIKAKGFEYNQVQTARAFFVGEKRQGIIVKGPETSDKKNVSKFRAKHRNVFIKNNRVYAKFTPNFSLESFLKIWLQKHKEKVREMGITGVKVLG